MILQKETPRGQDNLITPNDVPASQLIQKLAKYLKENIDAINPPQWSTIAKTGSHTEKQPQNPDWWYTRCASILRKIYIHGPIGIEKLRADYGGRKDRGVKPDRTAKAGGSTIRKVLQQLETVGYIETQKTRGRKTTRQGRKLLQELAEELNKELTKQNPELKKYQTGA